MKLRNQIQALKATIDNIKRHSAACDNLEEVL